MTKSIELLCTKTFKSTDYLINEFKDCFEDLEQTDNLNSKIKKIELNQQLSCFEIVNQINELLDIIENNNDNVDITEELINPLKTNYNDLQSLQTCYFNLCYYQQEQDFGTCDYLDNYFETVVKEQLIKDFNKIKSLFN